jgi:hypothetical protein
VSKRPRNVVISLAERRPVEKDWSPVELLEELLAEVKAGRIDPACLMVFWTSRSADKSETPHSWSAGVTYAQGIAFCELEKMRLIAKWRGVEP